MYELIISIWKQYVKKIFKTEIYFFVNLYLFTIAAA